MTVPLAAWAVTESLPSRLFKIFWVFALFVVVIAFITFLLVWWIGRSRPMRLSSKRTQPTRLWAGLNKPQTLVMNDRQVLPQPDPETRPLVKDTQERVLENISSGSEPVVLMVPEQPDPRRDFANPLITPCIQSEYMRSPSNVESQDTPSPLTKQRARPPSPQQTIVDLIKQVEGTGELVALTYAYGSRPGQVRNVSIISLSDDESAIKVRESEYPDEKTYIVVRIMEMQTQEGETAKNNNAISKFHEYNRQRFEAQRERQDLIDTCEWGVPAKLKDCRFDVSKVAGGYLIWNKNNCKSVTIRARDIESARRAAFAIDMMLSHSRGYWWDIQQVMVKRHIFWPNWMALQEAAYQDGQRIARQFEEEQPLKIWAQQSFRARCDLYAKSPFWGQHEAHYMDWGRIFEAKHFDMESSLRAMSDMPLDREQFKEYILGSNQLQKPIALPNDNIGEKTLTKLLESGLASLPEDPAIETILSGYRINELKDMAEQWNLKTTGLKKAELVQLCANAMPRDVALHLIADNTKSDLFLLQPPKNLEPEEFQNFKSCYRQMFSTLAAWIDDDYECSEAVNKLLG